MHKTAILIMGMVYPRVNSLNEGFGRYTLYAVYDIKDGFSMLRHASQEMKNPVKVLVIKTERPLDAEDIRKDIVVSAQKALKEEPLQIIMMTDVEIPLTGWYKQNNVLFTPFRNEKALLTLVDQICSSTEVINET